MKICRRQTAQCQNKKDKKGKGRYDEKKNDSRNYFDTYDGILPAGYGKGSERFAAVIGTVRDGKQGKSGDGSMSGGIYRVLCGCFIPSFL